MNASNLETHLVVGINSVLEDKAHKFSQGEKHRNSSAIQCNKCCNQKYEICYVILEKCTLIFWFLTC